MSDYESIPAEWRESYAHSQDCAPCLSATPHRWHDAAGVECEGVADDGTYPRGVEVIVIPGQMIEPESILMLSLLTPPPSKDGFPNRAARRAARKR